MRGRKRCYENRAHEGRPRVDEVDGAELCREVGCPEEMSTLSSVNQGRPKAGDTIQLSTRVDQRRAIQYNRKSTKEGTLQARSLPGLLLLLQSFCHRNYFKQLERISNPVQLFCHRNYFKQIERISKPEVLDGASKDAQCPSFTLLLLFLNL